MGCRVTSAEVTIFLSPLARFSFSQGLCLLMGGLQDGMGPEDQVLVQKLVLSKGVEEIQIQRPSRKARSPSHQLLLSEMWLLQSWLLPFLGGCWFSHRGTVGAAGDAGCFGAAKQREGTECILPVLEESAALLRWGWERSRDSSCPQKEPSGEGCSSTDCPMLFKLRRSKLTIYKMVCAASAQPSPSHVQRQRGHAGRQ